MKKYVVHFCFDCGEETKHEVLECKDKVPYRIFETVFTFGFGAMLPHYYKCECQNCGRINTVHR